MEKWKLKSYIKTAVIFEIWSFFCIFITGIILKIFIGSYGIWSSVNNFLKLFAFLLMIVPIFLIGVIVLIYLITNIVKNRNEVNSKEYYRDIEEYYTPAMASFLVDYKVEKNECILATVLDLYVKKYLNILKEDNRLKIEVINNHTTGLYSHERYIVYSIMQRKAIELKEFQDKVEQDCINNKLVNRKAENSNWIKFKKITLISAILSFIMMCIFRNVFFTVTFIIGIILNIIVLSISSEIKRYTKTCEGEIVSKKFKDLKNYLKEYTLLSERDIDYINISDRYLPFALALGVADKLENSYMEYNKLLVNYIKRYE